MNRIAFVVLAIVLPACAAAPRTRPVELGSVDTGAGTLAQARMYLKGRWNLQSFTLTPPGQAPVTMVGSGFLDYDDFGNLEMELRPDAASARRLEQAGMPVEGGIISTKGRTAIDLKAQTITYVLEGGAPLGVKAGPLASNRPRHWKVEGNHLTLTTNGDDGKPIAVGEWVKETPVP